MKSTSASTGEWVRAGAMCGDGGGVLWVLDGNEKDPHAGAAVDAAEKFLVESRLLIGDIGECLLDLDEHLRGRRPRLVLSALVARASHERIVFAFVGEARGHLLDADGNVLMTTRDHNLFSACHPEDWKRSGYSENEAKGAILRVIGDGVAVIEMHLAHAAEHGRVVGLTHGLHKYRRPDEYQASLRTTLDAISTASDGEGIATLEW